MVTPPCVSVCMRHSVSIQQFETSKYYETDGNMMRSLTLITMIKFEVILDFFIE